MHDLYFADKLVIYDRETGADITPVELRDPPKREGKKITQQVDFRYYLHTLARNARGVI